MGWWESLHLSIGYFSGVNRAQVFQPGGVSVFSMNQAAHRVIESGHDQSGLGRWSWTRYRGRNQVTLRIISAYRPVSNKKGPLSVYNQHRRFFYDQNDDRCPWEAFMADLSIYILECLTLGDQLVLALDLNDDIRSSSAAASLVALGLQEVLLHRHGAKAPPTYNRGSTPIDAIFVSPTLLGCHAGYMAFGEGIPSDHRCLWLDIPFSIAFGHDLPPVVQAPARRLKCNDPRIVKRYLDSYSSFLLSHWLVDRAFDLQGQATYPLSPALHSEWESIDLLRVQGMRFAESHCRKFRQGGVAWSPTLQKAIDSITLFQLICKRRKGVKVSGRLIHRLAAKIDSPLAPQMTLQEATSQLHQSFRTYKQVKKDGSTLRQTWMEDLASALASTGKTDAATHLTNLLRREQQRRMFRHIKYVSGQLRSGSVTSVIAPLGQDQAWIEVSTKLDIERACLEENERRFRQANGTPFMVEPLRLLIGDMGIGPTADAILLGTFIIPDGTDPFAAKLLPFLAMSPAIRDSLPIATTIDTPTYMAGWQRAKERTSSGPSGLHFGHFKAGCQHPLVADFDAMMVQIPLCYWLFSSAMATRNERRDRKKER